MGRYYLGALSMLVFGVAVVIAMWPVIRHRLQIVWLADQINLVTAAHAERDEAIRGREFYHGEMNRYGNFLATMTVQNENLTNELELLKRQVAARERVLGQIAGRADDIGRGGRAA